MTVAMASAANKGKREGRQRWPKQRQRKGRHNQPKSGSNSSENGAGGGAEAAAAVAVLLQEFLNGDLRTLRIGLRTAKKCRGSSKG